MRYVKLLLRSEITKEEFINYWSRFYSYELEHLYDERITKKVYTKQDVEEFYIWKNGGNLSKKKKDALEQHILKNIETINRLKKDLSLATFEKEFKSVSAIWKIFLLHIIAPDDYPIFDQHVGRAFHYLTSSQITQMPLSNTEKERLYFEQYVPFFNKLSNRSVSRKKLDEALWAFGKFLKTNYAKLIVNESAQEHEGGHSVVTGMDL